MEPPMAIICKCRLLSDRDKGEVAVFRAAFWCDSQLWVSGEAVEETLMERRLKVHGFFIIRLAVNDKIRRWIVIVIRNVVLLSGAMSRHPWTLYGTI
jgi:hypothetical protein